MNILPKAKPQANQSRLLAAAISQWHRFRPAEVFPKTLLVGVRGYYRDTMGKPGQNDRGLYDDALFIVGPETYSAFNANTDPSRFSKGIATLLPGCHPYRPGLHGISRGPGYPAFRPATPGVALPVSRDGEPGRSKRDGVAINIHRGSYGTTSSEGCQTLHPTQWPAFHALLTLELRKAQLKTFWYVLLEGAL